VFGKQEADILVQIKIGVSPQRGFLGEEKKIGARMITTYEARMRFFPN
jgi:hypothetical protein